MTLDNKLFEELDLEIIKEIPYQEYATWDYVENIVNNFIDPSTYNARNPEWRPTDELLIDMSNHDSKGIIRIKNEADKKSNPTETSKDRPAHEETLETGYYWAKGLLLMKEKNLLNGNINSIKIPTTTILTSGNWAASLAYAHEKRGMAPANVLLSKNVSKERLEQLKEMYLNIYLADTDSRELTGEEILKLTKNDKQLDLTSNRISAPWETWYDWQFHEVVNQEPNEVYMSIGAGKMFESYLHWQNKSYKNEMDGEPDERLKIPITSIMGMSILGAKPENQDSVADMLTAKFMPFQLYDEADIDSRKSLERTGINTGKYLVPEELIEKGFEVMKKEEIKVSYNGATALGLYMKRVEEGKTDLSRISTVINSGKGL